MVLMCFNDSALEKLKRNYTLRFESWNIITHRLVCYNFNAVETSEKQYSKRGFFMMAGIFFALFRISVPAP